MANRGIDTRHFAHTGRPQHEWMMHFGKAAADNEAKQIKQDDVVDVDELLAMVGAMLDGCLMVRCA